MSAKLVLTEMTKEEGYAEKDGDEDKEEEEGTEEENGEGERKEELVIQGSHMVSGARCPAWSDQLKKWTS